jgi:acetyl esterase/lipase
MRPFVGVLLFIFLAAEIRAADKPLVLDVWPGRPPGAEGGSGEEKISEQKNPVDRHVTSVSKPTIAVFLAPKDKNTGTAVLIAPGGGYNILSWDKEGEDVARWLNTIGVTGIVLKYRVPRPPSAPKDVPPLEPLMDAQRALSLVRSKAADWNIDTKRLGMLGFSAGGHLTAATATNFDKRSYDAIDAVDKESCGPDFAVLIYPAYLIAKDKDELNPDIRVSKDTPPCFFAHAGDDAGAAAPENSIVMYLALKKVKVPAELHVYASGGHGFGLRPSDKPCSTWPKRCEEWLASTGLLKPASGK